MYREWPITIPTLTGEEERKAYVYVPDLAILRNRRCPVLYMFDGQNLFRDEDATYGKCWGMLDYLTDHRTPLIIAAIECNHHAEDDPFGRLSEYSPFDFSDPAWGKITGRGKLTMDYYVNQFKPYIDATYPTLPEPEHTFIGGSSMGGLMTLYALAEYGDVFSRGAALSPAFGFAPEKVLKLAHRRTLKGKVLYMDMGSKEIPHRYRQLWDVYGQVTAQLIRRGVLLTSRVVPDGVHNEASWELQVPILMQTLFYDLPLTP